MGRLRAPDIVRNRDFDLYWAGVILSEVGTRGTLAANLYHVYGLTGSIANTGLVGLAQAVAQIVLSPLGGVYADRLDRRRLLQCTQAAAMLVALALAVATAMGEVSAGFIIGSVLLTSAAATFDQPARQALIPAMVPREQLPQAFALLNPSREIAVLLGPALAGVFIAVQGPVLMYAFDACTYGVLIVALAALRIPPLPGAPRHVSIWRQMAEGAHFVASRKIIWLLISLDLSAVVFSAYRVLLPAISVQVLHVGPAGYGLLASAPSAGALLASYTVFRVVGRSRRLGRVLLTSTLLYAASAVVLAQAHLFAVAIVGCLLLGAFDAMATTIRHAAVQLETPDELRGRVSSIYQMASRGGPAVGDALMGAMASLVGAATALTLGAVVTAAYAAGFVPRPNVVREYAGPRAEDPAVDPAIDPAVDAEDERDVAAAAGQLSERTKHE